jgi:DNA-binding SARP family transcriptional activator/tetratricopeptide (TPR) repeat protein
MPNPVALSIQVLGPFVVTRDGMPVPAHELASRKGRTLLKLLLARRGGVVPAEVLAEALWGDRPPADPDANLATLVSRLRAVLGPGAIAGGRDGWRFVAGPRLTVDLDDAERLVAEAEGRLAGEPALALAAAQRALDLLGRGPVLAEEPDADWAEPSRRAAERLAVHARQAAWRAALAVGDQAGALAHAEAALGADPLDEAAHRAAMLAHLRAGEPAAALAAYERLRATLADELGTDPAPDTQALHLAILRGATAPAGEAASGAGGGTATPGQGVRPPVGEGRVPEAGFVGREAELEELAGAWTAAAARRPSLLLVAGEAGIGKTRLIQEAAELARATGGLVAWTRCYEAERSLFLQPLTEAVRTAVLALPPARLGVAAGDGAGTLAELVPEVRRLLDPPPYQRAPAELERRRSFEAVTGFFRGLAAQQPVLLVVDDLHQAGTSTLELLHFLARRLDHDRLLLLATVRAEEGAEALAALADVARVLELGPLPPPAVAELARRLGVAGLAVPVLERTRGHTLFAVEALRAAAEGAGDAAVVPATLREAVLARVRRAGREVETLVRAAVVVGAAFDLEVVADLLGVHLEEATGRAERALAARLLLESETGAAYEFANDLVREVLYETTPRPSRVARHRRLAVLLAGRPEAAAGHAAAAGDWASAATRWLQAAGQAARAYANRDAERLLGEAVTAAERAADPDLEARARLERGRVRLALGDYPAAFADQETALRLAREAGQDGLEAVALEQLGWTAYYARDSQAASELPMQPMELAERAAAARGAAPSALLLAARIRHAEGDLPGARDALDAVLGGQPEPATRRLGRPYLGLLLEHGDRFAEARRVLDEAVEECRAAGMFRPMLTACFAAALASGNLGDLADALARLATMERLLAHVEDPLLHARAATTGSWLWRELGDLGRARELAERAVELTGPAATSHPALHAQLALAECLLQAGGRAEAAALLELAGGRLQRPFAYRWRVELRHAELASRIEPAAAERLLDLAGTYGSAKYRALALARLGRNREALQVAAPVESDYLLAQVAGGPLARAALDRMAAALPPELRPAFMDRGRLAATLAGR